MKHGGDLGDAVTRYGGRPDDWLDLSTGINPYSWPIENPPASCWQRLPEAHTLSTLKDAARGAYDVPRHLGICAAPGTEAILSWLPHILPSGDVAIYTPTYSSHAEAWRHAGRMVHPIPQDSGLPDQCRIVVAVNPNNPDGRLRSIEDLYQIADRLAARNGTLIVDEAFCDVLPKASIIPWIREHPVLVLRSFGKFYGLAGLRLGFLIGPEPETRKLQNLIGSWAVSGPALQVGMNALSDPSWQAGMREQLKQDMAALDRLFQTNGLTVVGGTDLYRLVKSDTARDLHDFLAKRRIWTRIFDYNEKWIRFGLPGSTQNLDRLAESLTMAPV